MVVVEVEVVCFAVLWWLGFCVVFLFCGFACGFGGFVLGGGLGVTLWFGLGGFGII